LQSIVANEKSGLDSSFVASLPSSLPEFVDVQCLPPQIRHFFDERIVQPNNIQKEDEDGGLFGIGLQRKEPESNVFVFRDEPDIIYLVQLR
jgi:hypothetical protein